MQDRTKDYLIKMYQLCLDIEEFLKGYELEAFLTDKRTQNAVAMSLLALGETSNILIQKSPEFIEQHTDLPWKYMRGIRNIIAHGYFDLDFVIIFETATKNLFPY